MTTNQRSALASAAIAAILVMLAIQLWFMRNRQINVDEFEHAHASWSLAHGLVPYRDFFEHHTPLLYFLTAPSFGAFAVETDPAAAVNWFRWARAAMFAVTLVVLALTYRLAALDGDRWMGILAATLLATSSQFMDTMIEFRPDVPALLCWLIALLFARHGWRARRPIASMLGWTLSGLALGTALMFTQKYLLVGPGFALALPVYVVTAPAEERVGRLARIVAFAAAVAVPIAVVASWFAAHGALREFVQFNVGENVRLNRHSFSPLPRIVANVLHSPALVVPGVAGLVEAAGTLRRAPDDRTIGVATAVSLIAGLLLLGRVYEQYVITFLPQLSVLGSAWLIRHAGDVSPRGTTLFRVAPAVSLVALLVFVPERASMKGTLEIVLFASSAAVAGWAGVLWVRRAAIDAAGPMLLAVMLLAVGNLVRGFYSNTQQFDDLRYVTTHTQPTDATFAASADAGVFRPHVWFYFFHSGPFATDAELAAISDAIVNGRVRPQIVKLDDLELPIPGPIWTYVHRHYRPFSPTLFERTSTEGRTSTATKD